MAYSLTTAQIAALTSERDILQTTVNTYDSAAFIAATNTGVAAANEVDQASVAVWDSFSITIDGTIPRETEIENLDGITVNNKIPQATMNNGQPLYNMGAIQPVIDQITDAAGTAPATIESSALIRLNINRHYPDVDDKDDAPDSDSRNVFPDHTWYAYTSGEGAQTNALNNATTFQSFLLSNPVMEDGVTVFIGDNERFLIYYSNFLGTAHSGGTTPGTNSTNNVSLVSVRGTTIGGTCTIASTNTGSGTNITYSPAVGDILNIGSGKALVTQSSPGSESCMTPMGSMTQTCTRSSSIQFINLTLADPTNGSVTATNQSVAESATKRTAVNLLKRFAVAIIEDNATNTLGTPAINTQAEVTAQIAVVVGQLGTRTAGIYRNRYNIANTRCNWNNGTLSALISREFSRLNLFNPATLNSMMIIDPQTGMVVALDFVNEYTRTVAKIAEIQAILDGAT